MNNTERIYHIEDTVSYIANKVEKDNRMIISLLKKLIEKIDSIDKSNSINDLSSSIRL